MNYVRRFMAGALWSLVCGLYQRFVVDLATPVAARIRAQLIAAFGADARQPVLIDLLLVLSAVALFIWICNALRSNRIFQWLYQIASFGLLSYLTLFTWQLLLLLAYLIADVYPEYLQMAQTTIFDYIGMLLFGPPVDPADLVVEEIN